MSADTESGEGETTRITRKGQVTIPKALREEFGLQEGDELRWTATDDGIVVRRADRSAGRGMLVDDDVSETRREEMATEFEETLRERRETVLNPGGEE